MQDTDWKAQVMRELEGSSNTFWDRKENILDNFRAIGMSALYDFEAVGGFVYDDYPSYYSKGE